MRTLIVTLAMILAAATQAQPPIDAKENGADNTVVGSWFVQVTPAVQPSFVGLTTFHEDGAVIETNALTLASSLESPGHGQWMRVAPRQYALTFVNLEVNPDGSFAGTGKVRATITLGPTGQEWTGSFQVDILDPGGTVLFSDSGMVSGSRIVVEQ